MASIHNNNKDKDDQQEDLLRQQQGYTPLYVTREDSSDMTNNDLEFSTQGDQFWYDRISTTSTSDENVRQNGHRQQQYRRNDIKAMLSRAMRIGKCTLIIVTLISFSMFVGIMVGAFIEERAVNRTPCTFAFYNSSNVCATNRRIDKDGTMMQSLLLYEDNSMKTFNSSEKAHQEGFEVVHCGDCGQCSTWNDMEILTETKTTLTKRSKLCAAKGFFGGENSIAKCVHDEIGFTGGCQDCWVKDMMCTFSNCVYTCLKSIYILREQKNVKENGLTLNSCLECDERMCGPAFLHCAGVNRRRLGIETDIHRNSKLEQCHSVDVNWPNV